MKLAHRLLIASIGDDMHSIGIALITLTFEERGFLVRNLGVGNRLDKVFEIAADYDAILISCSNGHAALYLGEFSIKKEAFDRRHGANRLWYLGGNLSVSEDAETTVRRHRRSGFDFVAPKPIDFEVIHERLLADLHNGEIHKRPAAQVSTHRYPQSPGLAEITDEPLTDDAFDQMRAEVLATWKTGSEVHTTRVKDSHRDKMRNMSALLVRSQVNGLCPLLQPRTGVAHTGDEIEILEYLRGRGSDISSIQLDAASRKNMYEQAEEGLRRSTAGGQSFLNGYPVPIHGVDGIRRIVAAVDAPFQIRAGSPDHRLTYEIGLAGGATSLEGGFLCYLLPYDATTSPTQSLDYWKYIDKLTGWYLRQHQVTINREYFGPLTTTLIEPTVPICINLVQGILSAKSGVKCISVGLAEQGNRAQDVAALRVLRHLMEAYLTRHGHSDVRVSTVFHQYMGAFPIARQLARSLIKQSATTGALAGATKIMTKTPVEATRIPNKEENAEGLRLAAAGIFEAKKAVIDHKSVGREYLMLKQQVQSVMMLVEELGNGSLARGLSLAFQQGVLEVPFSPSQYSGRQQLTLRDADGAIRFLRPNLLPFEPQVAEFHEERVHDRMTREASNSPSELVRRDLTRISNGEYAEWPLDGRYIE